MQGRNNVTNKADIALGLKLLEKSNIVLNDLILKGLNAAEDPLKIAGAIATLPKKYHNKSKFLTELSNNEAYADRIARLIFIYNIRKIEITSANLPIITRKAMSQANAYKEKLIRHDKQTAHEILNETLRQKIHDEKADENSIKSLILSNAHIHTSEIDHLIKIKSYSLISFILKQRPHLFTQSHFEIILPQLLAEKNYTLIALCLTQRPDFMGLNYFQTNLNNLAFSYFEDTKILNPAFVSLLYKAGFRLSTTKKNDDNVLTIAFSEKNIPHLDFLLSKKWIEHFSYEELAELLSKLLQEKMYDHFRYILNLKNDLLEDYIKINGSDGGLLLAILEEKPNQGHIRYFCENGAKPEGENQSLLSICKERRNHDAIKIFLSYTIKKCRLLA